MLKLLFERNFGSLNVAQFVTAFNDNALKQLYMLMTVRLVMESGGSAGYEHQAYATALFSIPFILFSGFAGRLSDRISKQRVIVYTKFAEILIMAIAALGLLYKNLNVLLVAMFLLSLQSTFFSPSKYGIMPEMLPKTKLSAANGLLQTTGYLAILIGTASSGLMLQFFEAEQVIGAVLVCMAFLGWSSSLILEPRTPADPEKPLFGRYPFENIVSSLSWIVRRRDLMVSILGFAYVWFAGSILLFNINVYGMDTLRLGEALTSLLTVILSLGLAAGCLLAGKLSGDRIESGMIPIGSTGMGTALLLFAVRPDSTILTVGLLIVIGLFGGAFLIPLQTLIQELPEPGEKGEALGVANVVTFVGVLCASGVYYVAEGMVGMTALQIMASLGLLTVGVGLLIVASVPRFFVRFILFCLARFRYRISTEHRDRVPEHEATLLFARPGSPLDPLIIEYVIDRPLRFVLPASTEKTGFPASLLDMMNVVRIDDVSLEQAVDEAASSLDQQETVCVILEPDQDVTQRFLKQCENKFVGVDKIIPIQVTGTGKDTIPDDLNRTGGFLRHPVHLTFQEPIETPITPEQLRELWTIHQDR